MNERRNGFFARNLIFVTLIFVMSIILRGSAATITWTNASSGSWSAAANWSPNRVPGIADMAVITNSGSYAVTLDGPSTLAGLTLGSASGIGTQILFVNGFTLEIQGSSLVEAHGQLNLNGGGFTGTGSTLIKGTLNWTVGQIGDGASLTVAEGGTLNIQGIVYLHGALTNYGTVVWSAPAGNPVYGYQQAVIYNAALWQATTDNAMSLQSGSPTFINAGTFEKTAGDGVTMIGWTFSTTGSMETSRGSISIDNWNGDNILHGSPTISSGTLNGYLDIASGATLNSSSSFTIPGSGSLSVSSNAVMNWAVGQIGADASLTVAEGGVLNVQEGVYLYGALTNYGTMVWSAPAGNPVYGYQQAVIYNAGLWQATTDNAMSLQSGSPTFINAGSFEKMGGGGVTGIGFPLQNRNDGSVTAQVGNISFNNGGRLGGLFAAADGTAISFAGEAFVIDGPVSFQGPGLVGVTSGSLAITSAFSGALNFSGASLSGANILSGTLNWNGGQIDADASLTVAEGGTLNIQGIVYLHGALTNYGTVVWSAPAGNPVYGYQQAVIYNAGLWQATTDNAMSLQSGSPTFINAGTFEKTAGDGVTMIGWTFSTTGSMETSRGSISIDNWNGDNILHGSPTISSGTLNGYLDIASGATLNSSSSFTIPGSGSLSVSSNAVMNWAVGQIGADASLTVAEGGVLNVQESVYLYGALTNYGTVVWSAPAGNPVYGYQQAVIYNAALWQATTDNAMSLQSGSPTFINAGTFEKTAGDGVTMIGWTFSTTGSMETLRGSISIDNWNGDNILHGSPTISSGTLNGYLDIASGATLNSSSSFTIPGSGSLSVSSNAVMNWAVGQIGADASLTVAEGGVLNVQESVYLYGALTNYGTMVWSAPAGNPVYGYQQAVIYNAGLWQATTDNAMSLQSGSPTFINAGSFEKMGGGGVTGIGWAFQITGTLAPKVGTININGTYSQTGATLKFGVNSSAVQGRLNFLGKVNLDGTLAVTISDGYSPASGDSFSLIAYGSQGGVFNKLAFPTLPTGLAWELFYNASTVDIQVLGIPTAAGQITGSVHDRLGHPIADVSVFAYKANSTNNIYLSSNTDAQGNYALSLEFGHFAVPNFSKSRDRFEEITRRRLRPWTSRLVRLSRW